MKKKGHKILGDDTIGLANIVCVNAYLFFCDDISMWDLLEKEVERVLAKAPTRNDRFSALIQASLEVIDSQEIIPLESSTDFLICGVKKNILHRLFLFFLIVNIIFFCFVHFKGAQYISPRRPQ